MRRAVCASPKAHTALALLMTWPGRFIASTIGRARLVQECAHLFLLVFCSKSVLILPASRIPDKNLQGGSHSRYTGKLHPLRS